MISNHQHAQAQVFMYDDDGRLHCVQVMNDEAGQVAKCYDAETLSRLKQLKARCDPLGLLRSLS
jgi:hypothetical protein